MLDVLLDRRPYAEASAAVWKAVETRDAEGLIAAHAVTTIHYLMQKELGAGKAKQIVSAILRVFEIALWMPPSSGRHCNCLLPTLRTR